MSAFELFFMAQDAADAGHADQAEALFAQVLLARPVSEVALTDEPPLHVIRSMALNGQAEQQLDRALAAGFPLQPSHCEQLASEFLRAALQEFPENVTALMNAALLARDEVQVRLR